MTKYTPLFIIGLHRAGTSEMFRACTTVLGYKGIIESHVWPIFQALVDEVESSVSRLGGRNSPAYKHFLIGQWGSDRIKDQVFQVFNAQYHQRFGAQWVDKTPGHEMIRCVPLLGRRFPNAGFIFMKRRPIENIQSRFRRFGRIDFAGACNEWAEAMQQWLDVRAKVEGRYIEIDQQSMALEPQKTADRLSAFLDLTDDTSAELANFLRSHRTEQTRVTDPRPMPLEETDWTDDEKQILRDTCGTLAEIFGYSLNGSSSALSPEHQVIHFNFTSNSPNRSIHSPSGKTFFHPLGLRLYCSDSIEYVDVANIPFSGQNLFVAEVENARDLQQLELQISTEGAEPMRLNLERRGPGVVGVEFTPVVGPATVRISIGGGTSDKPRRVHLIAPRFEVTGPSADNS